MQSKQPKPKYEILKSSLVEIIKSGEYVENQKFLSESSIKKRYDVSTITVRHALRELQNEGHIYTIKKKGSFIAPYTENFKSFFLVHGPAGISAEISEMINKGIQQYLCDESNIRVLKISGEELLSKKNIISAKNSGVNGVIFYREIVYLLELRSQLDEHEVPYVYFGSNSTLTPEMATVPRVYYEEQRILNLCISFMREKGHRNIIYMGISDENISKSRCVRFVESMVELDMGSPNIMMLKNGDFSSILEIVEGLPKAPAAFICATDRIAVKLIQVMQKKGFKVPEQVSVLGIDNSFLCEYVYPGLSSVDLKNQSGVFESIRYLNRERLVRRKIFEIILEPVIVERSSVASLSTDVVK